MKKKKNNKRPFLISIILVSLLLIVGLTTFFALKDKNNNSSNDNDYYLYINEDLVKDTYYYGEDFEFAQNMNIATLCKKEDSNSVYASSLSNNKNKKGQEIDNKDLTIEGFDSDTHGKKAVKIKYKDYYKIIEVNVKNCSITSIRVISESNLFVGEKVDKLELEIRYSDGHTIYDEYSPYLGVDTATTGTKTKTINYPFYSIDWEYKVHEFDEEGFEKDINIQGNLFPFGYNKIHYSQIEYKDPNSEWSRRFNVNVKINCDMLGEKTTDIIIKKSDILNDSNKTGDIVIPYTYTVDNAESITPNMKNWLGFGQKFNYVNLLIVMNNGKQFSYSMPVETTDEYNTLGEHSYTINFAGQTTTYNYTVVDIESVETYDWEDVYYYHPTQNQKILKNYTVTKNSQPSILPPSETQPSERIDKFYSLNKHHEFVEGKDYSDLDMPNILSNYEFIVNDKIFVSPNDNSNYIYNPNLDYTYILNTNYYYNNILNIDTFLYLNGYYITNIYYEITIPGFLPIKVNYSNGETEFRYYNKLNNINFDDKIIDCSKLGEAKKTFNYCGHTFDYTYQVKKLDSIEVLNVDKVYANNIPTKVEIKIKAKDGTYNYAEANVVGGIVKGKKINLCFEYLDNYYEYSASSVAIVELVCKNKLEFVKNEYVKNKVLNFTVKYTDNTQEDISITFDSTQIDTSKPVENAKLTFKYFGKYYTFEYDVLDYEFEVKEEYKTIYQGEQYNRVEYTIKYSNGTSSNRNYVFPNDNKIKTSVVGTFNILIYDNERKENFTYKLTIIPLVDSKLKCINKTTLILGQKTQLTFQVLDSSDKVLYTIIMDEYLDTSKVLNNIEKTFTYLDMSCSFIYDVIDIGQIEFSSKQIYYVGETFKELKFNVVSYYEGKIQNLRKRCSYSVSLKPEDLGDFDITKSKLGVNKIKFNYCGYVIDFVYYYGEKGSVELQQNTFKIERTTENRIYSVPIPMLITIGDYQFIDNSAVHINNIDTKDAGTYTYKFMYDDQEFEITYTIVDTE